MSQSTGSAEGVIEVQQSLYFDGAPNIWFQEMTAPELYNPDASGFYWQLSGTVAYPVYELGCANDVVLTENLTLNDVICDAVGVVDTVQRRNYLEFTLSIQTLFPLEILAHMIKGGGYVLTPGVMEQMGLGEIDPNKYYHVYASKVYSESLGAYVAITMHRAKFMDAFSLAFRYGNNWNLTGIKIRAFADTTKPTVQRFATIIRADSTVS
jgi:hypothetical protein